MHIIFWMDFGKYAYWHSLWELNDKINTTLLTVCMVWSWSCFPISLPLGLILSRDLSQQKYHNQNWRSHWSLYPGNDGTGSHNPVFQKQHWQLYQKRIYLANILPPVFAWGPWPVGVNIKTWSLTIFPPTNTVHHNGWNALPSQQQCCRNWTENWSLGWTVSAFTHFWPNSSIFKCMVSMDTIIPQYNEYQQWRWYSQLVEQPSIAA